MNTTTQKRIDEFFTLKKNNAKDLEESEQYVFGHAPPTHKLKIRHSFRNDFFVATVLLQYVHGG